MNLYGKLSHDSHEKRKTKQDVSVPADILWELLLAVQEADYYLANSYPSGGCSDEEERANEGHADNLSCTIHWLKDRMGMPHEEWHYRRKAFLCPECGESFSPERNADKRTVLERAGDDHAE